jgi:hypothetical protein
MLCALLQQSYSCCLVGVPGRHGSSHDKSSTSARQRNSGDVFPRHPLSHPCAGNTLIPRLSCVAVPTPSQSRNAYAGLPREIAKMHGRSESHWEHPAADCKAVQSHPLNTSNGSRIQSDQSWGRASACAAEFLGWECPIEREPRQHGARSWHGLGCITALLVSRLPWQSTCCC